MTEDASILLADIHLVASSGATPYVCDVYVENGRVASIDESGSRRQATDVVIDCSHHVAIPGLANLHVHCRP